MASSSKYNNNGSLKFVPNERHFSAIIRGGDSISLRKLVIPERYVTLYGDDLPSRVTLKVPSGAEWKVQIVRSNNGEISFQKGWPEFANYYSLVEGSSLVFKYENSSTASGSNDDQYFNVIIFDKNRIEIDYPFSFNVNGDNSERVSVDQEERQVPEQPTDVDESDSDSSDCIEFIFGSTKQNEQKVKEEKDNSEGTKRRKANEASSSRATPNPTFTVEMNASKFLNRNKYILRVPRNFVENMERKSQSEVTS